MFRFNKKKPAEESSSKAGHNIPEWEPLKVEYFSNEVTIPRDFLSPVPTANDALPVTIKTLDWKNTCIPEYEGRYAVVLDNVLSRDECDELIRLAESSVDAVRVTSMNNKSNKGMNPIGTSSEPKTAGLGEQVPADPWRPAMINAGPGIEFLDTTYRNSDRIIWDSQEVVDRLWARCLQGEAGQALREQLAVLEGETSQRVAGAPRRGQDWAVQEQRWEMRQLNRRMRFLRYGPGQFFNPHCDGRYVEEIDGKTLHTLFTVHLYLNDSIAEAGEENAELVGGATSFLSNDDTRKIDVDPKAGRVLIFQQRGLNHSGDWVTKGLKYTMRTEVMYEWVQDSEAFVN